MTDQVLFLGGPMHGERYTMGKPLRPVIFTEFPDGTQVPDICRYRLRPEAFAVEDRVYVADGYEGEASG